MKKLKKASLDELAERMPIIKDQEKAEVIGGHYYFSKSDNYSGDIMYFGSYGTGDGLYFVDNLSQAQTGTQVTSFNSSNVSSTLKSKILRCLLQNHSLLKWADVNYNGLVGYAIVSGTGTNEGTGTITPTTWALSGTMNGRFSLSFAVPTFIIGTSHTALTSVTSLNNAISNIIQMACKDCGGGPSNMHPTGSMHIKMPTINSGLISDPKRPW